MAERYRTDDTATEGQNRSSGPSADTDWRRGYDETVRRGPPLDTEVARSDYRPRSESLAPAGVRGYGGAEQWGAEADAQQTPRVDRYMSDEPIINPPPDYGVARAWGREGGWYHGGTGALRRSAPKGYRRSDERIREDLCEHLMDIADIDSSDVSVEVREGCVVLEGTVPQRSMRYEIEDIAATTLGVTDVENHIRVPRQRDEDRRTRE
jgi:hypothetical protein